MRFFKDLTGVVPLPVRSASCALRCEAFPPSNLACGLPWRTDLQMQRATVTLRLDPGVTVHHIAAAIHGATLVEVREGVDPEAAPSWPPPPSDTKPSGIPRTELLSMFRFKAAFSSMTTSTPSFEGLLTPERSFSLPSGLLQITLLCAWEPTQRLGVDSVVVNGFPPGVGAPEPKRHRAEAPSPAAPEPKKHRVEAPAAVVVPPPASTPAAAGDTLRVGPSPSEARNTSPGVPFAGDAPRPLVGCVVVLSGFVNPLRAELRDKALSLGAVVHNDWSARSTHLVAAMLHTPKVAAAKASGHGWVVAKEWVLHAFVAKARPKEGVYRLPGDAGADSEVPRGPDALGGGGGGAFRLVM